MTQIFMILVILVIFMILMTILTILMLMILVVQLDIQLLVSLIEIRGLTDTDANGNGIKDPQWPHEPIVRSIIQHIVQYGKEAQNEREQYAETNEDEDGIFGLDVFSVGWVLGDGGGVSIGVGG